MKKIPFWRRRSNIIAFASGAVYGLFLRIAMGHPRADNVLAIMSMGFIFFVPFVMGGITIYLADPEDRKSWVFRVSAPFVSCVIACVGMMLLALEGSICIILMLPGMLVMSALGGLIVGLFVVHGDKKARRKAANPTLIASFALLPLLLSGIERRFPSPTETRVVETTIEIAAPKERIWENIISVPRFTEAENVPSWTHKIGFPRPLAATLSHEGLGGVRQASFERDVVFVETVDEWEPGKRLGFSIKADAKSIPQTTLDEHVTVGGPYFDVLHGEYLIEPLANGHQLLRLKSDHRLTTFFNFYASVWTDAIMQDVQGHILRILKTRCEATDQVAPG